MSKRYKIQPPILPNAYILSSANQEGKVETETSQEEIVDQPEVESEPEVEEIGAQSEAESEPEDEIETSPSKNPEDNDAHQSEAESELEVQSKEQPPNENVSQSEGGQDPEPEIKNKQPPVKNGSVKTQDRAPVKKKLPQQQRQAEPQPAQPLVKQQRQPRQVQVQNRPEPQYEPQFQYQPEPQKGLVQQQQAQYPQVPPRAEGYRRHAIRESRIKDRPERAPASNSALKIKIELDLEVEVDLYARVKGDITIGLMQSGASLVFGEGAVEKEWM